MELGSCCSRARGASSRREGFCRRALALGFEVAPAASAEGHSESCQICSVALLASMGGGGLFAHIRLEHSFQLSYMTNISAESPIMCSATHHSTTLELLVVTLARVRLV